MPQQNTVTSGGGERKTTRDADMSAFDALPPEVREALNYHPLTMSSEDAAEAIRQGWAIEDVLRAIAETG